MVVLRAFMMIFNTALLFCNTSNIICANMKCLKIYCLLTICDTKLCPFGS